MKYKYGECTYDEYIKQYNPIKLQLNKTYIQNKGTWQERHYRIVMQNDFISIGMKVYDDIYKKCEDTKEYEMFYTQNGFKYRDVVRPIYRLTEQFKENE